MKKIFSLLAILSFITFFSCTDYLTQDVKGQYSTDTFYKSEAEALLGLTGVYNNTSFTTANNAIWVFGDVASDDAVKGGSAGILADAATIDNFSYARDNTYITNMWVFYYEGISRANFLLYALPGIDMPAKDKARIEGEAKFLRAYFYFNLVNIYGQVPIRTLPPSIPEALAIPKSPVADVYAQIESDLTTAAQNLPSSYSGTDIGRATKGAAWGLLAKAHLYQGEWAAVLTAIDSVDKSFAYALVPYGDNFKEATQNNKEDIFEIQHLSGQTPSVGSALNQFFQPTVYQGYGVDNPVPAFVKEFEKTADGTVDPRLDYTVGRKGVNWVNGEPYDTTWSPTGYLSRKHVQSTKEAPTVGNAGLDYVYLRYADILLMKAEALNELNQTASALVPLNLVRARARAAYTGSTPEPNLLPDVTSTSQTTVRDAIRHERRVELGMEFHRYFDLMRYGKAVAEAAIGAPFVYETFRYFPIPSIETRTNPAIPN